jgi:hypothetical protein
MSIKRTVFIGPVQAVEDYLNYTKISYFSPPKLEERRVEGGGKKGRAAVLHTFPPGAIEAGVEKMQKFIVMSPLDCGVACSILGLYDAPARFCLRNESR